ncbi:MAG: hypothetical protein AB1813_25150, partial [Verrucomicrobiota bacterium]
MKTPTTEKLATIAAILAQTGKGSAQELAEAAMQIWKASENVIRRHQQQEDPVSGHSLPHVKAFPITTEQMVKVLLPKLKGRTAEAAATLRAYCKALLISKLQREPTDKEAEAEFSKVRRAPVTAANFQIAAQQFLQWHNHWK